MGFSRVCGRLSLLLPVLALAACGGDSPSPQGLKSQTVAHCTPMIGSQVSASTDFPGGVCGGCNITGLENATDGNLGTFATITVPAAANGQLILRATAPAGIVYPAGGIAAVLADDSTQASAQFDSSVFVASYLGGALQDEASDGNSMGMDINGNGSFNRSQGLPLGHAFDALEFRYESAFANNVTLRVYEFCSQAALASGS